MRLLIQIKEFILGHDFQVSFWSGIAVSVVVGFIVYQYTDVFKSPNLSFVVKQNGIYRNTILLSSEGDSYKARFQFAIKNSGSKSIKANEGYWHLYVHTTSPTRFSVPEEQNHNRDLIQSVVYPESFLDINLVYELTMKKEEVEEREIPYFFSTDYGQYPRTAKVDSNTGIISPKTMGHIKFELPD